MRTLVFATGNPNKVAEANQMLEVPFQILSLQDINCTEDIPETSATIEGNALQKARYVSQNYDVDCFAEDTGLVVDALDGDPGVYSARYAGPARDAEANMNLLLNNLKGESDRSARFVTVIALIIDGEEYTFEGIAEGVIIHQKKGHQGFGYDPVFQPEGFKRTFAQMSTEEKNKISHRAKAVQLLNAFLKNY